MTQTAVKNAVARRAEQTGSAVAPASGQLTTLAGLIDRQRPEIARALPKHMNADRMARIALTLLRQVPKLAECTPESFLGALMTCSQLGMEPGPTQEAYIIPRWNKDADNGEGRPKGAMEASFQLGYQGMVKLFWQHPLAAFIDAQVVHENDGFDYELGLDPKLVHKPAKSDRGKAVAYYAVARLTNGGHAFRVMFPAEIEEHRQKGSTNSPAWRGSYSEMAKKTCIRAMFKLLPKSTEIAQALAMDETVRTDVSLDAIDAPAYVDAPEQRPALAAADTEAERDRLFALIGEHAPGEWDAQRLESEFAAGGGGVAMTDAGVEQLESFLAHVKNLRGAP